MSYSVFTIPPFDRQLKRLTKKFPSLKTEYANLVDSLESRPVQGVHLAVDCYKIRVAIKSKGKGKSGGARIIVQVRLEANIVYLLTIYDKSEIESLSNKEIQYLLSFIE